MNRLRSQNRVRNIAITAALTTVIAGFGLYPFYITEKRRDNNLLLKEKGLTGTQTTRGAYINSGSHDVGPDPDWDMKTRTYKGLSRRGEAEVDEEVLKRWRKELGDVVLEEEEEGGEEGEEGRG